MSAAILLPTIVCTVMVAIAAVTVSIAHVDVSPLLSYLECAIVTFLCVLCFIFIDVARLASVRADEPLRFIRDKLDDRWPLLVLPALVLPIFLMGYTAAKCSIPYLVGYTWDGFWADVDQFLFGNDVWRIARRLLGSSHESVWEWYYSFVWVNLFLFVANAVAYYGKRRFVGIYFTAMLGTWLVGGCVMAYAFSAAGPVFAASFDASLTERFRPLVNLMSMSAGSGPIPTSQYYLQVAIQNHIAAKGGGISAMPSMHLGAASIYVLAARRTKWLVPAVLFWATIFVLSGYFGFHYWVDGIVAAGVAAGCWFAAEAVYSLKIRDHHALRHGPEFQAVRMI